MKTIYASKFAFDMPKLLFQFMIIFGGLRLFNDLGMVPSDLGEVWISLILCSIGGPLWSYWLFSISAAVPDFALKRVTRLISFSFPTAILFCGPTVSPSILPMVWGLEIICSFFPVTNMILVMVKAAYRGWFALNNPYDSSRSIFSINGNLIEMAAMSLIIIVCPIWTYFIEAG